MNTTAIAIDIGGTAIKYGLTDTTGAVLWEETIPTPRALPEALVQAVLGCIRTARSAAHAHPPTCVGIGTPGLVDSEKGVVIGGAGQLPGWEAIPLSDIIARETGLPAFLDNDANLMGLGEYTFGQNTRVTNAIFFTLGTGIGGAIFINGQLYRGSRNAGGELGCFPFHHRGRQGYWEDFASVKALIAAYNAQKSPGAPAVESAKTIFEQAAAGDPAAATVIAENIDLVGQGIAGYINIFNPDRIIIGGGISAAQSGYVDRIREAAFQYALKECCSGVELVAASLGNRAGFIGAGYFALNHQSGTELEDTKVWPPHHKNT